MSGSPVSIPRLKEPLACPRCRTAWRLKRGLCVSCLLSCGLDAEMNNGQTLDVHVRSRLTHRQLSNPERNQTSATVKWPQPWMVRSQLSRTPYFLRLSALSCNEMARSSEIAACPQFRQSSPSIPQKRTPLYFKPQCRHAVKYR
jgi:hypothetical protein